MKYFIHLSDLSKQEISHIFELADRIKEEAEIERPLYGKTIVLFFPESSIRTRVSFEKGIQVSEDAIDSEYFVGYEFKKPLLEVQQAIICYLLGCM